MRWNLTTGSIGAPTRLLKRISTTDQPVDGVVEQRHGEDLAG
jgi:hypothetical protein